ncbi:ATPase [Enterococcus raffinosus]|jgi:hypothetical protein|uniref:ATPase n=1 Tax=Enterococcus raffinosus TaxID=71452 RepID=A0AAW8TCN7_9ENTE|nr:ATPase [Enterococcus raffinosus]MDT2525847.1 ATPase [Enterococcus raffinosus]MDT2530126.1 ATPase [Enterococcus raffinosus]MDT2532403.1 ATPase [Enterococcus raffinosus]MDT2546895.1 ATPase [Enterococcus raffinosus]MDT2555305.1 ATPase [Enterococcus raffinosus]
MKILKFLKYKFIDARRAIAKKRSGIVEFKEYGLRLYSGPQGSGKSMSMVEQLERYRLKFPDLLIATNFFYKHETMGIKSLSEIPVLSRIARENGFCGVVIGWDEIQNDFDNSVRSFPITILRTITQQRKQGIKILATSQVFTRVAKPIREQTFEVVECKTLLGRWTFQKWFDPLNYEFCIQNPDKKEKLSTIGRHSFIQTDEIRELFDSYAVIDSLDQRVEDDEKVISAVFGKVNESL